MSEAHEQYRRRKLRVACANGGGDGDIVERCTCDDAKKHVRECEVYTICTWETVNPKVMSCAQCQQEGLGFIPGVT